MTEPGVTEPQVATSRFVRLYGERPRHLVVLLACFALTAYTVLRLADDPALTRIVVWFVGCAVVWDLVLAPAFALADRALRPLGRSRRSWPGGVSPLNHVRVPGLLSALLLLVWAPLVLQRSEDVYRSTSGLGQDVFLGRWLLVSAVLFGVSGVLYAVAVVRRSRRG